MIAEVLTSPTLVCYNNTISCHLTIRVLTSKPPLCYNM
nr:MAG TPA: hypothetical protein [Caudoviricetes sp.]